MAQDITPTALEAAFQAAAADRRPAAAALIVSPTYFGVASDISGPPGRPAYQLQLLCHEWLTSYLSQSRCSCSLSSLSILRFAIISKVPGHVHPSNQEPAVCGRLHCSSLLFSAQKELCD